MTKLFMLCVRTMRKTNLLISLEITMKKIVSLKSRAIIYSTKVSWWCQLQIDGHEMMFHQVYPYQRFLSDSHILDPICSNAQPLFACSHYPYVSLIAEHSAILCSSAASNQQSVHVFEQPTLITQPSLNCWKKQLPWSSHLPLRCEL